ncbi:MAG: Asp-tRNA(Asn)/Glu-tRNA(Gln) amidotransferase subunit GatC [bacterium]|nr:Asp-tRNA(Asn)/Glu-tRNA(Gln) amidotransferase subunit GatC [bacterium]
MISKEDIEHLKDLARVEFGEEETKKLAKDMQDILGYIDILKEADVAGVASASWRMAYSIDLKNVFRKDEEITHPLPPSLIDSFPEKFDSGHGTYLKVPAILGEKSL